MDKRGAFWERVLVIEEQSVRKYIVAIYPLCISEFCPMYMYNFFLNDLLKIIFE